MYLKHEVFFEGCECGLLVEDGDLQAIRERLFEKHDELPQAAQSCDGGKAAAVSFIFELLPGIAQMGEEKAQTRIQRL